MSTFRRRLQSTENNIKWDYEWKAGQQLDSMFVSLLNKQIHYDEDGNIIFYRNGDTYSRGVQITKGNFYGSIKEIETIFKTDFNGGISQLDAGFGFDVYNQRTGKQHTVLITPVAINKTPFQIAFFQTERSDIYRPIENDIWYKLHIIFDFDTDLNKFIVNNGQVLNSEGEKQKWIYSNTIFAVSEGVMNANNQFYIKSLKLKLE